MPEKKKYFRLARLDLVSQSIPEKMEAVEEVPEVPAPPVVKHEKVHKGIRKGGLRRMRKTFANNTISRSATRKLARRGGIKRICKSMTEETQFVLRSWLQKVLGDAIAYTDHAHRKTVTKLDVLYALKHNGRTLYG